MFDALEKDLHVKIGEKSKKRILNTFRLAVSLQLPVLDEGRIAGILDLYAFLDAGTGVVNVAEIMERDIVIAGTERDVFSFKRNKQMILPFVDAEGNYIGFISRFGLKCYLPSMEYLQVIERTMPGFSEDARDADFEKAAGSFNAVFETNYDGLYITVDKGRTLSVNERAVHVKGLTQADLSEGGSGGIISLSGEAASNEIVTLSQILQNKREISISEDVFQDGGIIRLTGDTHHVENVEKINNYEQIAEEISEMRRLRIKYQSELEMIDYVKSAMGRIVAESPEMRQILSLALRIAKVDTTVLIQGDSGAGKSMLGRLIHENSSRKDEAFVKIDCSSIPESLLESELFGYEQGAFTGAEKGGKPGLAQLAEKGTLFLDEIAEIPPALQAKLLRLIQEHAIIKVGGQKIIKLDIRIIAATNRDLAEMVRQKLFRKDLYYRLNVVPIVIPPLRQRKEDVRPLIEYYLNIYNQKYSASRRLNRKTWRRLLDYAWPGNIRELQNLIEYLIVTAGADEVMPEDLPEDILKQGGKSDLDAFAQVGDSLKDTLDKVEKKLLIEAMRKTGSTEEMAVLLGVDRSTIIRKLKKHGVQYHFS